MSWGAAIACPESKIAAAAVSASRRIERANPSDTFDPRLTKKCGANWMGASMGPLHGIRIVEFAGIGPGPFAAMLLSDMGAEVIRIDRKAGGRPTSKTEIYMRGRKAVALDMKKPE